MRPAPEWWTRSSASTSFEMASRSAAVGTISGGRQPYEYQGGSHSGANRRLVTGRRSPYFPGFKASSQTASDYGTEGQRFESSRARTSRDPRFTRHMRLRSGLAAVSGEFLACWAPVRRAAGRRAGSRPSRCHGGDGTMGAAGFEPATARVSSRCRARREARGIAIRRRPVAAIRGPYVS
jgi:hypothetical protein